RISGETDFPCITDDKVGLARSYAKVDGPLTYRKWLDSVRDGRSYVSDGQTHLMDFTGNGTPAGPPAREGQPRARGREAPPAGLPRQRPPRRHRRERGEAQRAGTCEGSGDGGRESRRPLERR